MIRPGDNIVRVYSFHKGQSGIYDIYQFGVINLDGETHGFCYKTPAGTVPIRLVRDLLLLRQKKLWFKVYLKEVNRLLAIHTIKEPEMLQDECWHFGKKVVA